MPTKLDHIVVGAASLDQGIAYIQEKLGIDIPKGGEHPLMGTHNHVMQLGNESFLEVIAINPDAPPPTRPRWFGLDDPSVQYSVSKKPRLLTWVVNTTDLVGLQTQMEFALGVVTPLSRGDLSWLFAVPDDGRLLAGGLLPHAMQWQTNTHPSNNMADLNCRFSKLTIHHPYKAWMESILADLQASKLVTVQTLNNPGQAFMTAEIETPGGMCTLSSQIS